MKCPKCGSENVKVQIVSEEVVRKKKHGWVYYVCVAWWLWAFKLMIKFIMWPVRLITGAVGKTEKYTNTEHRTMCVCQNCGKTWELK